METNLPAPIQRKPKRTRVRKITVAQAKASAESIGMAVVKIDHLLDHERIGAFVEQLGATKISRSVLLTARNQVDDALTKIDTYIAQSDSDLPLIIELRKLQKAFLDLKISTAQAEIRAAKEEKTEAPQAAPLVMAFPPGTAISTTITSPEIKNITDVSPDSE